MHAIAIKYIKISLVVAELVKEIAQLKGLSGYQSLLKAYISEGLRQDKAKFSNNQAARLIEALKKRGVPADVLDAAAREMTAV